MSLKPPSSKRAHSAPAGVGWGGAGARPRPHAAMPALPPLNVTSPGSNASSPRSPRRGRSRSPRSPRGAPAASGATAEAAQLALVQLDEYLLKRGMRVNTLFTNVEFNTSGVDLRDTVLDAKEFGGILEKSGVDIPKDRVRALCRVLDRDGSGDLDVGELEAALKRARMKHHNTVTDALTRIKRMEDKKKNAAATADFNFMRSEIFKSRQRAHAESQSPRSPGKARSLSPRSLDKLTKTQSKAWLIQKQMLEEEAKRPKFALDKTASEGAASPRPAWRGGGATPGPEMAVPPPGPPTVASPRSPRSPRACMTTEPLRLFGAL